MRKFDSRIVMLGCGSVGQGLLPLLFRNFAIAPDRLTILTADEQGREVAARFGVQHLVQPMAPDNYQTLLEQHLRPGDWLLNLSVEVSSLTLIVWCKAREVLYLDTCVEPWRGGYSAHDVAASNALLRRQALSLHTPGAATAVIAHGMNPGLISHLLKEALLALAQRKGVAPVPDWGALAQQLGVKAIHIAERDTQDDGQPLPHGVFTNTWSAQGLYSEACLQRAELGWGSHETLLPAGAETVAQDGVRSLCLAESGAQVWLKSWLPSQGEQRGMLVTHHEVVSIAALLACGAYQPTVCYVYHPCPKACASLAHWRAGKEFHDFRVLEGESLRGFDEIGILLVHETGALWHGSTLDCADARRLAPHNSATTLQVAAGIVGAMVWMQAHPRAGVVEAEDMDSGQVLAVARPYLGRVATFETDWRPGPQLVFGEFVTEEDGHQATGYSCGRNETWETAE
jgi:homospermidine synthase